jgi:hypothetical protein
MKRLILILMLVLSIVLLVSCSWIILDDSPIFKGKLTTSWDVSAPADNGDDWLDVPDEAEIGDTFTGSSGITYKLEEENISNQEKEYYNSWDLDCSGVWVEIGTMSNN